MSNDCNSAELAALTERLSAPAREERLAAAMELRRFGPAAVEPLIHALRDSDPAVRQAVIESLGALGDPRAIRPLVKILHESFGGFTARDFRLFGLLMVLSLIGGLLMIPTGLDLEGAAIAASCIGMSAMYLGFSVFGGRRQRSRLIEATGRALAQIAEHDPRPELRSVMDDLRVLSADVVQVEAHTRKNSREFAARLDTLTERLKSLPLSAEPPVPDARVLPQPAATPEIEVRDLPQPSSGPQLLTADRVPLPQAAREEEQTRTLHQGLAPPE